MPSSGVQTCALRSEEHTSELQSLTNLVCRLLLEKTIHFSQRNQRETGWVSPPHFQSFENMMVPFQWNQKKGPGQPFLSCSRHPFFFLKIRPPPRSPLFPTAALFL